MKKDNRPMSRLKPKHETFIKELVVDEWARYGDSHAKTLVFHCA
jgi:hypothetical protein